MKNKVLKKLKILLKKSRYEHTLRVRDLAIELAEIYGEDVERIELAALFHDYAKGNEEFFIRKYKQELKRFESLGEDLKNFHIIHGPLAAIIAQEEYGIEDKEFLDALIFHSTGVKGMTNFQKIIYLADKTEKKRNYFNVNDIRKASKTNLDKAMLGSLNYNFNYLIQKHQKISIHSFELRNDLIEKGV